MGSNYFGDLNTQGNEPSSGSSSSRKGKKSKPKQPQRGLGVAQLEKIRLHAQMAAGYIDPPFPVHSTINARQTEMVEIERSNSRPYDDFQPSRTASQNYYSQPNNIQGQFSQQQDQESVHMKGNKDWVYSMGSSSQNYGEKGTQELDLELRLSL